MDQCSTRTLNKPLEKRQQSPENGPEQQSINHFSKQEASDRQNFKQTFKRLRAADVKQSMAELLGDRTSPHISDDRVK